MGSRGEWVVAPSEDGRIFVWRRSTGALINMLAPPPGDDGDGHAPPPGGVDPPRPGEAPAGPAVCAVAPHPSAPRLASGSLDAAVRLWEPAGTGPGDLGDAAAVARANAAAVAARTLRVDQAGAWYSVMMTTDARAFGGGGGGGGGGPPGARVRGAGPAPAVPAAAAAAFAIAARRRLEDEVGGVDPGEGGGGRGEPPGCAVM
jgi:hypothetical protein